MFRALLCSSSGGSIVYVQHLVPSLSVSGLTLNWLREISVEGNPYRKKNIEGGPSSPDIHKQGATVTSSIFTKTFWLCTETTRHRTVNLKVMLTVYLSTQTDGNCHRAGFHTTRGFSLTFSDGFMKWILWKCDRCLFDVFFLFVFGATAPQRARASSFTRFLDHIRRTTVGRTPLDEWSARRRDLYLTTHNTHNSQTSMPPVGFEHTISEL